MRIYPNLTVDGEFKSLGDQGHMGTLNDRQFSFLRSKGYQNSLADMMTSWLAYSPANLFSVGEQGVWFDPSDVANLNWRRNLLTWTEQFDNAAWSKTRSSISANAAVAPDGTTTADKIVEDSSASTDHRIQQTASIGSSAVTASVYIKAAERTLAYIRIDDASTTKTAWFNLSNGTVGSVDTGFSASISDVGNGWYRCVVTYAAPGATTSGVVVFGPATINGSRTYTGDGTSGILLWGAQLELGSVATDYQRITDVNTEVIERFPTATLYQDTAGTTPVTTTGQSVGLMLDKSKGLVLGSETWSNSGVIGVAATIAANGAGWSVTATGTTFVGIRLNTASLGTATYRATVSWSGNANGRSLILLIGGGQITLGASASGSATVLIASTNSTASIQMLAAAANIGETFTFTVSSVKELPGNHAVQATTANRPIYGVHPFGGRRNLLERTEEFDNAYWSKVGTTAISANTTAAPDGNLTADTMSGASGNPATTSTNTLERVATVASSTTYTFSCYVAGAGSGTIRATLRDASTGAVVSTDQSLSGSFSRVSVTITTGAATTQMNVRLGNTSGNVVIWGAQLETGSTATNYQRVTDQYNVTEAGVSSVSYLFFDGVNDSLATPSINFTSTDKMTVFAGVRKLSDAATASVVELSSSSTSNTGTFAMFSPLGAASTFGFGSWGNGSVRRDITITAAAPVTAVLAGYADIANDLVGFRINGGTATTTTADQGTGSYVNQPLFIGARAGTSLFFSGHLYSLIVRGAQSNTGQVSSTETWVAGKTGITI
jgi:hypothetical protein